GEPATCNLGQSLIRRNQQVGVSTTVRAADATPQLIELRKAVPVCAVNDQGVRQRNVESVFDDRRRYKHIELVMHESSHYLLELLLANLPVSDPDGSFGADLLYEVRQRVNRFDAVVNDVNLATAIEFEIDRVLDDDRLELHDNRLNGQPVAGSGFDNGHVSQAA